jgi:hypothetical protein
MPDPVGNPPSADEMRDALLLMVAVYGGAVGDNVDYDYLFERGLLRQVRDPCDEYVALVTVEGWEFIRRATPRRHGAQQTDGAAMALPARSMRRACVERDGRMWRVDFPAGPGEGMDTCTEPHLTRLGARVSLWVALWLQGRRP